MDIIFQVSTPAKENLECLICRKGGVVQTNVLVEESGEVIPKCRESKDGDSCRCVSGMIPIIYWFKDLNSTDIVRTCLQQNETTFCSEMKTTIAASIIGFYSLVYSGCPFFTKYRLFVNNGTVPLDERRFFYMLLSSAAIERLFRKGSASIEDVFKDVKDSTARAKKCLWNVLNYSRNVVKHDAILNSVNMVFSLCNLVEGDYGEIVGDYDEFFNKKLPSCAQAQHVDW